MQLYHYKIGFPKEVVLIYGILNLKYSEHAKRESREDRYGAITLPDSLNTAAVKLIEAEVDGGVMVKGVYRAALNDLNDLVLVVMRDGFVRTVWKNRKNDQHRTLDRARYCRP